MFSRKYLSNTAVNIPFPTLTPKQTSGVATGSIKNARKIRRKLDSRCCWQISPKAVWRAMIHTKCRDECTKQIPDARIGTRHTYRQLIGSEGVCQKCAYPAAYNILYDTVLNESVYVSAHQIYIQYTYYTLLNRKCMSIRQIHTYYTLLNRQCISIWQIHIVQFWMHSQSYSPDAYGSLPK